MGEPMKKTKLYEKIPCLFRHHKTAKRRLRLAPKEYRVLGDEVVFCERCLKILAIGTFPPYHPNCEYTFLPAGLIDNCHLHDLDKGE